MFDLGLRRGVESVSFRASLLDRRDSEVGRLRELDGSRGGLGGFHCLLFLLLSIERGLHRLLLLLLERDLLLDRVIFGRRISLGLVLLHLLGDVGVGLLLGVALVERLLPHGHILRLHLLGAGLLLLLGLELGDVTLHGVDLLVTGRHRLLLDHVSLGAKALDLVVGDLGVDLVGPLGFGGGDGLPLELVEACRVQSTAALQGIELALLVDLVGRLGQVLRDLFVGLHFGRSSLEVVISSLLDGRGLRLL